MECLDVAVGLRTAGADAGMTSIELGDGGAEVALELVAVVAQHAFEAPTGGLQLAGDATCEGACLAGGGVAILGDDELCPGKG